MVEINSRRRRAEKVRPVQTNTSAPKANEEASQQIDVPEEPETESALSAPKVHSREQTEKTECRVKATRYVPREEVRKIFARDGESCSYTDPQTGKRCGSKWRLELDHRVPYAHAGENTAENLRIFCRTHNRRHAVEMGLNKTIRR